MNKIKTSFLAITLAANFAAVASPIELDTDAAHIIVIRPVDVWSGDTSTLQATLESINKHHVSYTLKDGAGHVYRGSPLVFQGISDHPVTMGVHDALTAMNTELVANDRYDFTVMEPVAIAPEKFKPMLIGQKALYRAMVIKEGNPATLPGRVARKKIIGNLASVATLALAVDKLGVNLGAPLVFGTGAMDDVYRVVTEMKGAVVPAELPDFDATAYKHIDVRRVFYHPDILGQVIIAYKTEKTDQAETQALTKAIVSLTGADTTPEAVEKARAEDLANRQKIWTECVESGKCEK